MGEDVRSEDDNVDRDTIVPGEGGRVRPVSEPPRPDAEPPSRPEDPQEPAGFSEWLSEWEDVRSGVDAHNTQEIPRLEVETLPDAVSAPPSPPDIVVRSSPPDIVSRSVPEPAGSEEPTEPNPAARIPSPPPVQTPPVPVVTGRRLVRASRPRPVSGAGNIDDRFDPWDDSPSTSSVIEYHPDGGRIDGRSIDQARQTTSHTIRVGGLDVTIDATQRAMLVTAALGMVVVAGLFAYLLSGLGSQTEVASRQADVETVAGLDSPDLDVSANSPAAPSVSELARSTVQIAGLDDDGETLCAGSGFLVGDDGIILTNAHVVRVDDDCPFTALAVGVTLDPSDPPELRYRGEVLIVDDALDLAVVQIVGMLSSGDPLEINPNLPVVTLGDSDKVDLGDTIRILGYPVIGGATITQTVGSVAGFVTEDGRNRALIKTEASISAGNSGGMAVNELGEVIGIPTRAGANGLGPPVDCRPVSDTNNDGLIDDGDTCVPIGGFLNSILPINLARDVLARAEGMQREAVGASTGGGSADLSDVSFWNPRFSTGEEDDRPIDEVITLTEGVEEICVFVDWSGIPNGVPWAAIWSHDGSRIEEFSIFKIWEYGESGRNFWYCAEDRRGHPAGVYEVGLFLNDELVFVESIEVTDEPVEIYEVTWVNKSDVDICGLAVNPLAFNRHAGVNVLDRGEVLSPGDSAVIELPAGDIVVEAYDCNGSAVAAELDGLSIPRSMIVDGEQVPFVIGGGDNGDGGSATGR